MEGYSQQGFRPGRRVLIIKDSLDPENVGKTGTLEFSHGPAEEITFRGMGLYNPEPTWQGVAWIVVTEEKVLKITTMLGRTLFMDWASYRQDSLMLIDDPDKELDTMEERLNNAHPLLLTHKQEENV